MDEKLRIEFNNTSLLSVGLASLDNYFALIRYSFIIGIFYKDIRNSQHHRTCVEPGLTAI